MSKSQCTYYTLGRCNKFQCRCFDCKEYNRNKKYYNPNNTETLSIYLGARKKNIDSPFNKKKK